MSERGTGGMIIDSHQHVFWYGRDDARKIYSDNARRLVRADK